MPRIGVAGTHGHGATHVAAALALEREGRAVLAAVADHRAPGPELAGLPAYHEASEMIGSEELDVIVLSTPMHTHLPLAEAALATGAHVLLEKPPTPTLDEFHRLLAAADAAGRAVQLGFQSLGSSAVPEMRRLVADGAVGEPLRYGALATWVRTEEYWRRTPWAGRRALDGVPVVDGAVTNPLAHAVATGLAIAGATRERDVAGVRLDLYRANDIEADDTSSLVVDLVGGGTLACALSLTASQRSEPCIVVEGTAGRLVLWYTLDVIQHFDPGARFPRPPTMRAGACWRTSSTMSWTACRCSCRPRRRARSCACSKRCARARHRPPSTPRSSTDGWATRERTAWFATSRPGARAWSRRAARSPNWARRGPGAPEPRAHGA